jgi:dolichol-phosphate mannosyltransferase
LVEAVSSRISKDGFKILFDIIASQKTEMRIVELPYRFRERMSGDSKLDKRIVVEYMGLIIAKATGDLISPRALMFGIVGASGLVVHLTSLRLLLSGNVPFSFAQTVAAITAMTTNFLINNAVTYRDRRLRGVQLLTGYLRFCGLCLVGLLANIIVADLVFNSTRNWWLAGAGGAAFGAIWNYVSTSFAVW